MFYLITLFVFAVYILLFIWLLSSNRYETKENRNKQLIEQYFRSEVLDKIDKTVEGLEEYKPDKFILGSHYWNGLPQSRTIGWKRLKNKDLVPYKKEVIDYKGMELILDENDKYRFDVE